jgi:hypothetical protein
MIGSCYRKRDRHETGTVCKIICPSCRQLVCSLTARFIYISSKTSLDRMCCRIQDKWKPILMTHLVGCVVYVTTYIVARIRNIGVTCYEVIFLFRRTFNVDTGFRYMHFIQYLCI